MSYVIPGSEIICGMWGLLVGGLFPIVACSILSVSFIIISVIVANRQLTIKCNCFGAGESEFGLKTILGNLVMLIGIACGLLLDLSHLNRLANVCLILVSMTLVFIFISGGILRTNWKIYYRLLVA